MAVWMGGGELSQTYTRRVSILGTHPGGYGLGSICSGLALGVDLYYYESLLALAVGPCIPVRHWLAVLHLLP